MPKPAGPNPLLPPIKIIPNTPTTSVAQTLANAQKVVDQAKQK